MRLRVVAYTHNTEHNMNHFDEKYVIDTFQELLAIDSTTGQFREVQDWTVREIGTVYLKCENQQKTGSFKIRGASTLAATATRWSSPRIWMISA